MAIMAFVRRAHYLGGSPECCAGEMGSFRTAQILKHLCFGPSDLVLIQPFKMDFRLSTLLFMRVLMGSFRTFRPLLTAPLIPTLDLHQFSIWLRMHSAPQA